MAIGLTWVAVRASASRLSLAFVPRVLIASLAGLSLWLAPLGSGVRMVAASLVYLGLLLGLKALPSEVTDSARRLWGDASGLAEG